MYLDCQSRRVELVVLWLHLTREQICLDQTLVAASVNSRSAVVIGCARNGGSGRGCFAPLDCEVNGLRPVLMSTRMSL